MAVLAEVWSTPRLRARKPRPDDAQAMFEGFATDDLVTRYLTWRPHGQIEDTRRFIAGSIEAWDLSGRRVWALTPLTEDVVIGLIELRIDGHRAELGYVLARSAWGRGYMTEAVQTLTQMALHDLPVARVAAVCDVDNVASARVLEKSGLMREGRLRRYILHPNVSDEPRDVYLYARTSPLFKGYRADSASTESQATQLSDVAVSRRDATGPSSEPNEQSARPPVVLIITGAPASGKSTIGRQLAALLGLPYLSKDLFKETLFDSLGWQDRAWSQRLGGTSMALLFRSAEALLVAGQSIALESNFYAVGDTPQFLELGKRYRCQFVQVVCTAPGPVLVERYEQRVRSGERHPGHADLPALDEWRPRLLTEHWDALELEGPVFVVDTSDWRIDFESLVRDIRRAVGQTAAHGDEHSPRSRTRI